MNKTGIAILLLAGLGYGGYRWLAPHGTRADAATNAAPVEVSVATAQRRALPILLTDTGRVEAKASVTVKARQDGQVAEIDFAEGRPVHKGQLLLRFDPAQLEAQVRQGEGVVAKDEAQLTRAQADYTRNQALAEQGFISKSGLNQFEADLHSAQATLKADRASLDNLRLQLDYTRVEAPIDGVAGAVLLPVGGAAKANDTPLLVINQIKPIYVTFAVPEAQLAALKAAMAHGEVPVAATVAGHAGTLDGKLAFIDNAVDATSGAILAKALFPNTGSELTPGQYTQVAVHLGQVDDALVVPDRAVENGADGPYLFVLKPDATAEIRKVKVGVASGGYSAIVSGLAVGEQVIVAGQARLRNKAKVVVVPAPGDAHS